MRTEFFSFRLRDLRFSANALKKAAFCLLIASCVAFTAFSCFYAAQTTFAQEIVLNKTFYFLIANGDNAQACLALTYQYGGAGYALNRDGNEYAVYACYNDEKEAENASETLLKNGRKAFILPQRCGAVYLRTRAQKARKNEISGWLVTLEDCTEALSFSIDGAESGNMSQSALKSAAKSVESVLRSLCKSVSSDTDKPIKRCAESCAEYSKELSDIAESVVFARDLRRVHAGMCDEYIRLASAYAL